MSEVKDPKVLAENAKKKKEMEEANQNPETEANLETT